MSDIYQFGDVVVDLSLRQIRRAGEVQKVQAKVFDLLCYLIEHRDRVLSKDDIQDAVWPDTVVTESSLSRAVMKARRAIDDSDQSVIINVHGVGYRFAAALVGSDDAPAAAPVATKGGSASPWVFAGIGLLVAAAGFFVFDTLRSQRAAAVEQQLEDVVRLTAARDFVSAAELVKELQTAGVADTRLVAAAAEVFDQVSITSEPPGAEVTARRLKVTDDVAYAPSDRELGTTPLPDFSIERATWLVEFRLEGYAPAQRILSSEFGRETINLDAAVQLHAELVASETAPGDMLFVPGGEYTLVSVDAPTNTSAVLDDFYIDKFEVSNAAFLEFVQRGGYQDSEFWPDSMSTVDGETLDPTRIAATFTDRSGMPGPLGWVDRLPRPGQEDWPVANVSWYEAAAYCHSVGKQLPTIFQWEKAARDGLATNYEGYVMPWGYARPGEATHYRANFQSTAPVAVDSFPAGISPFGAHAMAGNIKEWLATDIGAQKALTGGSFQDPAYLFSQIGSFHPATRLPTVGFRCASRSAPMQARLPEDPLPPDYEPVDREGFARILDFYRYDKIDANAELVETIETADWSRQKIKLDGPDASKRLIAYLWLPKSGEPPYQTMIYVPGADAFRNNTVPQSVELLVGGNIRSGRAAFAVVMRGMVEREFDPGEDWPEKGTVEQLNLMVERATELRLGVDYLVTLEEVQQDALAYVGLSWGAGSNLGFAALEQRTQAVVFIGGGIDERSLPALPEAASYNFAPYIGKPTLMLSGRHDEEHPWPTRARALWRLLQEPKELQLIDGVGHLPPPEYRTPAINDFLDQHLGSP